MDDFALFEVIFDVLGLCVASQLLGFAQRPPSYFFVANFSKGAYGGFALLRNCWASPNALRTVKN
jgi:hypothetical protein